MRIIFMGSPDFAVPTLEAIVAAGHHVVAVYCQPPRPAGRGKAPKPTPVQVSAEQLSIPVRTPASLKGEEDQAAFADLNADVAVVAAYGLILPVPVLESPRLGCINVHASLLPRWRGAAPVQRAIMAGDEHTGITLMQMDQGLDTGAMLMVRKVAVDRKNSKQLTDELATVGARMVVEWLEDPGAYPPFGQPDEGITYAAKIKKEEARLDWRLAASQAARLIRGLAPFPGAWFEHRGLRIKVLEAKVVAGNGLPGEVLDQFLTVSCGDQALRLVTLQRAGRAPMAAEEFLRGFPIGKGENLS